VRQLAATGEARRRASYVPSGHARDTLTGDYPARVTADEQQSETVVPELPEDFSPDSYGRLGLLRFFLSTVAASGGRFPLLLLANGMLIAGQAVSTEEYLRALADRVIDGGPIADALNILADQSKELRAPEAEEMQHVHLVEATVLTADRRTVVEDSVWQVPLTQVVAWTPGSATPTE